MLKQQRARPSSRSRGEANLTSFVSIIAGIVAGLVAGSFIATVAVRCSRGDSALVGRSRCDSCGAAVGPANLVPVVSFAIQRGKTRCCGARIDPLHPTAELVAALIGGVSSLLPFPAAIASAVLGWILLTLGLIDLRTFRLPQPIVVLLAASGLAASWIVGVPSLLDSAIGLLAGWAALEAVRIGYRRFRGRDGIGRGDPKLLGAIGAWVGWAQLPVVLLVASVAGLLWAAASWLGGRRIGWSDRMPLGTLIAVAAWPVWVWTIAVASAR